MNVSLAPDPGGLGYIAKVYVDSRELLAYDVPLYEARHPIDILDRLRMLAAREKWPTPYTPKHEPTCMCDACCKGA